MLIPRPCLSPHHHYLFFFFNDTATTEIYTLSLHDALPIYASQRCAAVVTRAACSSERWRASCRWTPPTRWIGSPLAPSDSPLDRKSTRLNSSHGYISYAVFCLKKKKKWRKR